MQGSRTFSSVSVVFSVLLGLTLAAPLSTAQEPAPPGQTPSDGLGPAVIEDPLTGPGLVQQGTCPTQRADRDFVEQGYLLKVAGRCNAADVFAGVGHRILGLTFADGEIRLDMKAVSKPERVRFYLAFRDQTDSGNELHVMVAPAPGFAHIGRLVGGEGSVLAERGDLAGVLSPDDWNTLAVRARGPDLALSVNGRAILFATDASFETGFVNLFLLRSESLDDDQEAAVVVRDLRVAGWASGEKARLPTYQAL